MTLVHRFFSGQTNRKGKDDHLHVHVLVVYLFQSIESITYIQMNGDHCHFTYKHVFGVY